MQGQTVFKTKLMHAHYRLIYILDVPFTLICMHEIPTGVLCLPRAQFLQSCAIDLFMDD